MVSGSQLQVAKLAQMCPAVSRSAQGFSGLASCAYRCPPTVPTLTVPTPTVPILSVHTQTVSTLTTRILMLPTLTAPTLTVPTLMLPTLMVPNNGAFLCPFENTSAILKHIIILYGQRD